MDERISSPVENRVKDARGHCTVTFAPILRFTTIGEKTNLDNEHTDHLKERDKQYSYSSSILERDFALTAEEFLEAKNADSQATPKYL